MSSAICFNSGQSKILSSGKGLQRLARIDSLWTTVSIRYQTACSIYSGPGSTIIYETKDTGEIRSRLVFYEMGSRIP